MEDISYIGKQIGSYRIIAQLDSGGFGSVYLAQHIFLSRMVAIKLLHMMHLGSFEARESFLQEARLLEALKHPHILPILDINVYSGFPYLVTEYAPNGSLRDLLKRYAPHPLPFTDALTILRQVGQALTYAHHQQIIHRDLKPENILFNAQNQVLLADFGLAMVLATASINYVSNAGTPRYMAPEQFKGAVSKESDQYALGCIAYELFTGKKPFDAADPVVLMYQHVMNLPPPPRSLNPDLPANIEHAVLKALAKERRERHASIDAFIGALQSLPTFEVSQPTVPTPGEFTEQPLTSPLKEPEPLFSQPQVLEESTLLITRNEPTHQIAHSLTRTVTGMPSSALPGIEPTQPHISNPGHQYSKRTSKTRGRRWLLVFVCLLFISSIIGALFLIVPGMLSPRTNGGTSDTLIATPPSQQQTGVVSPTSQTTSSVSATPSPKQSSTPSRTPSPAPSPTLSPSPIAPPTLSASTNSINGNSDCGYGANHGWMCSITLSNNPKANHSLQWSGSSSSYSSVVSYSPANGTIAPGQTMQVEIFVGVGVYCPTTINMIFAASVNTVTVPWKCGPPTITVSPTNLNGNGACGFQCTFSVSEDASSEGGVQWSAASTGILVVTVSPSSGSLVSPSAGSDTVTVTIPNTGCPNSATINVVGPGNTVTVFWGCR